MPKTVLDLVGKFHEVRREYAGEVNPKHKNFDIVLRSDLPLNSKELGRSVLEVSAKVLCKKHIILAGLRRVWMYDFELRERQVAESYAEEQKVA